VEASEPKQEEKRLKLDEEVKEGDVNKAINEEDQRFVKKIIQTLLPIVNAGNGYL
jgi:hypothetical protein